MSKKFSFFLIALHILTNFQSFIAVFPWIFSRCHLVGSSIHSIHPLNGFFYSVLSHSAMSQGLSGMFGLPSNVRTQDVPAGLNLQIVPPAPIGAVFGKVYTEMVQRWFQHLWRMDRWHLRNCVNCKLLWTPEEEQRLLIRILLWPRKHDVEINVSSSALFCILVALFYAQV